MLWKFLIVWVSVPRLFHLQGWHSPSGPLLAAAKHLKAPASRQPAGPHSVRGRWWCGSRYFPSRGATNGHPASPAIIALTLDALCKLSPLLSGGGAAQGERRSGAFWGERQEAGPGNPLLCIKEGPAVSQLRLGPPGFALSSSQTTALGR